MLPEEEKKKTKAYAAAAVFIERGRFCYVVLTGRAAARQKQLANGRAMRDGVTTRRRRDHAAGKNAKRNLIRTPAQTQQPSLNEGEASIDAVNTRRRPLPPQRRSLTAPYRNSF